MEPNHQRNPKNQVLKKKHEITKQESSYPNTSSNKPIPQLQDVSLRKIYIVNSSQKQVKQKAHNTSNSTVLQENQELNKNLLTANGEVPKFVKLLNEYNKTKENNENKEINSSPTSDLNLLSAQDKLAHPMSIESGICIEVQNIVTTAYLNCELNLRNIALITENVEYNPSRFAAMVMRRRNPSSTALIFSNGKIVCIGAKSVEDTMKSIRRYARTIQLSGYSPKLSNVKIQNMVGSCNVNFSIALEFLSPELKHSFYEPEIFPGIIYRILKYEVSVLIFRSGNIVFTGATQVENLQNALEYIYPTILSFKSKL